MAPPTCRSSPLQANLVGCGHAPSSGPGVGGLDKCGSVFDGISWPRLQRLFFSRRPPPQHRRHSGPPRGARTNPSVHLAPPLPPLSSGQAPGSRTTPPHECSNRARGQRPDPDQPLLTDSSFLWLLGSASSISSSCDWPLGAPVVISHTCERSRRGRAHIHPANGQTNGDCSGQQGRHQRRRMVVMDTTPLS